MNLRKTILQSWPIFILIFIASCHEAVEPKKFIFSKIFTGEVSKTWRIALLEETSKGEVIGRYSVSCLQDERYVFNATSDRLYEVLPGNNWCEDEAPYPAILDSWAFNNATATLIIVVPFLSSSRLPFIVRDVDEDDLELEIFFDEEGTGSYKLYFELIDEG